MEDTSFAPQVSSNITKGLMVVAVVAVVISALNFISMVTWSPTGHASSDEGNVTFEISSVIELNFSNNLLAWGAGAVLTPNNWAWINSEGQNVNNQSWNNVTQGLVLESLSNENVSINLSVNTNSLQFIDDGTDRGSSFEWKVTQTNLAGSTEVACTAGSWGPRGGGILLNTYSEIPAVSSTEVPLCDNFGYESGYPGNNEVELDIQLNISSLATAGQGSKEAMITAAAVSCAAEGLC